MAGETIGTASGANGEVMSKAEIHARATARVAELALVTYTPDPQDDGWTRKVIQPATYTYEGR